MKRHFTLLFNGYTLLALIVALVGSAVQVTPVYAASIVVNSTGDTIANDGLCTLREALIAAEQNAPAGGCAGGSGADTISFAGNYTITVGSQLPSVATAITITGKGMANTIIQADATPNTATSRVFQVAPAGNLTLDQVAVRNGQCIGSCTVEPYDGGGIYNSGILNITDSLISGNRGGLGGGIYNTGTLTVTNSIISDNNAFPLVTIDEGGGGIRNSGTLSVTDSTISGNQGRSGGGIMNTGGTLTVTNSTISGNSTWLFSSGVGGGILHSGGTATVTNSTITGNLADDSTGGGIFNAATMMVTDSTISGNHAGGGGGIDNTDSGIMTITNSTMSENSVGGAGGGIVNQGTLTVTNSTISGNSTLGVEGGGIWNYNGNLTVTSSTISGNHLSSNFVSESGAGIWNYNGNLTVTSSTISGNSANGVSGIYTEDGNFDGVDPTILRNTIVANNNGGNCGVMTTTITDGGGNLSWPDASCPGINADPLLGPLANNGGLTQTMALLSGSAAIDAGSDANCESTDQRGGARPQGSHCDIGAFESGAPVTYVPSFSDVPTDYWALSFIERLYAAGITGGCATSPLQYCPEGTVTRAQMSIFLLRGIHGFSYNPPPVGSSTGFGDVSTTYWAAAWIKQLAAEGITGGCGSGNYCPEGNVTRAQMSIFLLRAKHGASYGPPGVVGSTGFADVPTTYWAAAWIKQLVAEDITSGCGTGTYCPESPVNRAQMAVFLVRTFNLP